MPRCLGPITPLLLIFPSNSYTVQKRVVVPPLPCFSSGFSATISPSCGPIESVLICFWSVLGLKKYPQNPTAHAHFAPFCFWCEHSAALAICCIPHSFFFPNGFSLSSRRARGQKKKNVGRPRLKTVFHSRRIINGGRVCVFICVWEEGGVARAGVSVPARSVHLAEQEIRTSERLRLAPAACQPAF